MEATDETQDQDNEVAPRRPIVATAGARYRITHYIMVVVILFMAAWFAYDGFYNWPKQIRENYAAENAVPPQPRPHKPRTNTDVLIQKALAVGLPVIGIGLLVWCLMQSRGVIRFEDGVLHVPGHPPLRLQEMRSIDNERWDRKGIALIGYETMAGRGTLKLDDYHYQREPVDKIQKIVTKHLTPKKQKAVAAIVRTPPPPARSQRADKPTVVPPRPQMKKPQPMSPSPDDDAGDESGPGL